MEPSCCAKVGTMPGQHGIWCPSRWNGVKERGIGFSREPSWASLVVFVNSKYVGMGAYFCMVVW